MLLGPPLVPIWVAGFVPCCGAGAGGRCGRWRSRTRSFCVTVLVMAGQLYYPLGLLAPLRGRLRADRRLAARGRGRPAGAGGRRVALNTTVSALVALPLLPVDVLGRTPIPEINQVDPGLGGLAGVRGHGGRRLPGLSTAEQARAVLYTSNYGEAGALHRYGPAYVLPAVYSGHNELHNLGPPPDSADVAVLVLQGGLGRFAPFFATCETVGRSGQRRRRRQRGERRGGAAYLPGSAGALARAVAARSALRLTMTRPTVSCG